MQRSEATRERFTKCKQEIIIPDEVFVTEPVDSNEEIRKHKRAEAARRKYKQDKLKLEQRAR